MSSSQSSLGPITTQGPGPVYLRPELHDLRIIGVEEHLSFPDVTKRIPNDGIAAHAKEQLGQMVHHEALAYAIGRTSDAGKQRIKDMDEGGIAMQILSFSGAVNCMHMPDDQSSLSLAQDINNSMKKAVDANPSRFKALAELPAQAPELATKELHRCVTELGFVGAMVSGSIGGTGQFLDAPEFDGLLSAFEELDVPLYLHPGIAPKPITDIYYTFEGKPQLSGTFAGMGWGWHNEVAIHAIRLAVSGALDKHPKLKVVVGHQGEMLPMMLQRFDAMFDQNVFGLKRSVAEMFRTQVWIAISGLFSLPPTQIAIQTWGVDKVLFANDYPYIDAQRVPDFVKALGDLISPSDLRKICQTNAEALFGFKA
ncbi:hypothetical protein AbraIFM66951_001072 [Aspergillus brasiliensis]|uniref:Amidohydrolase-related domain-containing protein n=1 Tax=Aspergillus brasiliensis TaxID=319629 RepID=A0A9W5YKW4_9EURO|nr:hypothetical protein AbraCBS73388_010122 [Aspergillus brasiliensis]GKZ48831.1 hypothetical protein AbraIFM66951_001072 [Aspergillus brasiliensis]